MRWFKFKEAIPEALLDLNLLGSIKLDILNLSHSHSPYLYNGQS